MAPTSHFLTSTSTTTTLTRRSITLDDPISQALVGISVAAILITILILILIGRKKRTDAELSDELRFRPYDKDMSKDQTNAERTAVPLLAEPPLTPGLYPPPVASPPGRVKVESEERASYWVLSSRAGSRSPSPMGPRRL